MLYTIIHNCMVLYIYNACYDDKWTEVSMTNLAMYVQMSKCCLLAISSNKTFHSELLLQNENTIIYLIYNRMNTTLDPFIWCNIFLLFSLNKYSHIYYNI